MSETSNESAYLESEGRGSYIGKVECDFGGKSG